MFKTIVTFTTTSGMKGKTYFAGELLELANRIKKMQELGYKDIWTEIVATIPASIENAEPAAKSSAA